MIQQKDRDNGRYNDGELIRIFGLNSDTDEFELVRLKSGSVPWCLDISSPCYSSLNGVEEASKKTFRQKYAYGYVIDNTETNRDSETEFTVNAGQSYIVEFDLTINDSLTPSHTVEMSFGVVGLDVYGNKISLKSVDGADTTYFVKSLDVKVASNNTYHFYGVVYSKKEFDITSPTLARKNSYNYGDNLLIDDEKIVKMYSYLYLVSGSTQFTVDNYSVKPFKTDTSRMFVNDSNQYILVAKNKNYDIGVNEVKSHILESLMPYDSTLFFKLL